MLGIYLRPPTCCIVVFMEIPVCFACRRFSRSRSISWTVMFSVTKIPGGVRSPKRVSKKSHPASLLVQVNERYDTPLDDTPSLTGIILPSRHLGQRCEPISNFIRNSPIKGDLIIQRWQNFIINYIIPYAYILFCAD